MAAVFTKPQTKRETLFTFERSGKTIVCELRLSEYGVEAAFIEDGLLFYSQRFGTMALAMRWAARERTVIENEFTDL